MITGILYQDDLKEYDFGSGHPFRGNRYLHFYTFLKNTLPPDNNYHIIEADIADEDDLLEICSRNYIEFTRGYYEAAYYGISYPGKFSEFHSPDNIPTGKPGRLEEAARIVIGQAKKACQLVQEGTYRKVISIGGGLHHAKPNYGEGFCLYNDVAFSARYLLDTYRLDKIVILDTDAHAGNGTSDYFIEDPRVLFIDIHQDPGTIYPGTGFANEIGFGRGKGYTINIPLPLYSGIETYKLAFESIIEPVIEEFKPQIIIRNGGSDPHFNDGLTVLGMTVEGFNMIGRKTRALSDVCHGKEIDLIASGYNIDVLPSSWLAFITGLCQIDLKIEEPVMMPITITPDSLIDEARNNIAEVKANLKAYWSCFQ